MAKLLPNERFCPPWPTAGIHRLNRRWRAVAVTCSTFLQPLENDDENSPCCAMDAEY